MVCLCCVGKLQAKVNGSELHVRMQADWTARFYFVRFLAVVWGETGRKRGWISGDFCNVDLLLLHHFQVIATSIREGVTF